MRIEIIFAIIYGLFLLIVCSVSLCIYLHKKKLTLGEFLIKVNESLEKSKFRAGGNMKIKVIGYDYDSTERILDVLSFEFRSNQVTNWIKIKLEDGTEDIIHNVCVVKTIEMEDMKPIKGTEKEDVIKLAKYCNILADKIKELNDEVQELRKKG